MLGIVWGIVAVTLLMAYGAGFRTVLMSTFNAFGNDVIIAWPGTTSEQAGGERAGKPVHFQQEDVDEIRGNANLSQVGHPRDGQTVCRFRTKSAWRTAPSAASIPNTASCAMKSPSTAAGSTPRTWPSAAKWFSSARAWPRKFSRDIRRWTRTSESTAFVFWSSE